MDLQTKLKQSGMTKYQLSKKSGVPKTTIIDICAGRSDISKCSAKTVMQLALALGCSMEDMMHLDAPCEYNVDGLPNDKSFLECNLPPFLKESVDKMKEAWKMVDGGKEYLHFDADFCTLQSDINVAEVSNAISREAAEYLREKYLRIERDNDI